LSFYKNRIKPVADIFSAFFLLVIFSPVIIITSLFLAFGNKGKVFFFQERPGLNGKPFTIYKFKTMTDKKDDSGDLLPDKERMTRAGNLVRSFSLDELLQLVNVLKGDMSFIGPRPLLMKYLDLYSPEEARRHEVKPGITGWAQVNGRNAISWEEKFRYDVEYVNRLSFPLDLKILWLTVIKVLSRKGISAEKHVTMEEFKGKNSIINDSRS
jgi:undecaprenyl phosphate N,N'-diacetylbacillosamine 1-phosphate transferase